MKLTPHQLLMPMLIGFSLTGVSVFLLYLFTRKDEDEVNERRKTRIETSRQSEIQIKVPRDFMPVIIGRGGSVIKGIQQNTETQIKFNEEIDIEAPERICIIQGKPESIRLAEVMILTIIKNQPIIEKREMLVAQKHIGRIMGKGGDSIKQIQNASSARIMLDASTPGNDLNVKRKFIIKGTTEQIAAAVSLIEDKIREENDTREKLESNVRQPRSPRNSGMKEDKKTEEDEEIEEDEETEEDEESEEDGKIKDEETFEEEKPTATKKNEKTETINHSSVSRTELVAETLPTQADTMEIYVSAMESPSQFWVQVYGPGTLALDELVERMTEYYDNKENAKLHALKNITVDQMVAAKFNFDDRWYRSEVLSGPEDGEYEVFFADFGDRARIRREDILELRTDFLSLRLQAIECSLANIKPRGGEWSEKACDRFADLTSLAQWKRLFAKVKGYKERVIGCGRSRREGSPIPSIVIYDLIDNKEVDVGKELINEDMADPEEEVLSAASSTISISRRNPDFRKSPTPTFVSRKSPARSGKSNKLIHEIDLTTPIRGNKKIEEIDLVSPVINQTSQFISNEKRSFTENGSGDHTKVKGYSKSPNIVPAGGESDRSGESDFDLE